jgi:hypothetical protein
MPKFHANQVVGGRVRSALGRIRSTPDNPPKNALNQRDSGAVRPSMRRLNHAVMSQCSKAICAESAEFAQDVLGIGT